MKTWALLLTVYNKAPSPVSWHKSSNGDQIDAALPHPRPRFVEHQYAQFPPALNIAVGRIEGYCNKGYIFRPDSPPW